jgi:hypothetical protein
MYFGEVQCTDGQELMEQAIPHVFHKPPKVDPVANVAQVIADALRNNPAPATTATVEPPPIATGEPK